MDYNYFLWIDVWKFPSFSLAFFSFFYDEATAWKTGKKKKQDKVKRFSSTRILFYNRGYFFSNFRKKGFLANETAINVRKIH